MSAIEIPGYKIIKTLGVGGQATVYLAIQQGFDREVALKVMSPALAADPTFGERFIREAKIVAKLSHARIVTVYDVGESGSFYYLAMEYMRGEELKTQIAKGIKAKEALLIIAKLAQALYFAHKKGYIHRDVKSENILFDDDMQPVLTDFGIAKASNSGTQMTQTGKLIGTPEYMSPEQCRGRKLDGRSDLYSLGIILYEMMTRKVPFTGEDSVSVCIQHVTKPVPQLPARLNHFQWLVDGLLAKNPADRFQSGKELAMAIKSFLGDGKQVSRSQNSNSRTIISEVVDKPEGRDEFNSESFELTDDFNVDQRINVRPEKKSRVPLIAMLLIVVIASASGYLLRDRWYPQTREYVESNWLNSGTQAPAKSNISSLSKSSKEEVSNGSKKNIPAQDTRVESLIQQANTLAQSTPHELTDIRQALDVLITAKSLAPNNTNIGPLKNSIVKLALEEALHSANKNTFSVAEQWLQLVEYNEKDNKNLIFTKQQVAGLKQIYENNQSDEQAKSEQLTKSLQQAELAIKEGRLGSPVQNNAIYHLRNVEKLDPNNPGVKSGFRRVENTYAKLIATAIAKKQFSKAKSYLKKLVSIPRVDTNIASLEKQIANASKKYAVATKEKNRIKQLELQKQLKEKQRQQKLADPMVQMRLGGLLQAAEEFIKNKNLVEPIGNNALEKYRSALEIDALNEEAIAGIKTIETTILTNLQVAISNKISTSAELWFAKLRKFNPEFSDLDKYQLQLKEIKLAEEIETTANDIEPNGGTESQDKGVQLPNSESPDLSTETESTIEPKNLDSHSDPELETKTTIKPQDSDSQEKEDPPEPKP